MINISDSELNLLEILLVGIILANVYKVIYCKYLVYRKKRLEKKKKRLMRELLRYEYLNGVDKNGKGMGR